MILRVRLDLMRWNQVRWGDAGWDPVNEMQMNVRISWSVYPRRSLGVWSFIEPISRQPSNLHDDIWADSDSQLHGDTSYGGLCAGNISAIPRAVTYMHDVWGNNKTMTSKIQGVTSDIYSTYKLNSDLRWKWFEYAYRIPVLRILWAVTFHLSIQGVQKKEMDSWFRNKFCRNADTSISVTKQKHNCCENLPSSYVWYRFTFSTV